MSVIVKGGGGKPEEEKTVTAGTSVIEVNPSSGKVMKKVTVNPTPTESKSVTPTTSELTVTPSEGKHLSQVVVGAVEDVTLEVTAQTPVITQILEGLVGKAYGANATADKILEGYSAYVGQELVEGTAKEGVPLPSGLTKYEVGSFVKTSDTDSLSIQHSLGVLPRFAIVQQETPEVGTSTTRYINSLVAVYSKDGGGVGQGTAYGYENVPYRDVYVASTTTQTGTEYVRLGIGSSAGLFKAGSTYNYVLMA